MEARSSGNKASLQSWSFGLTKSSSNPHLTFLVKSWGHLKNFYKDTTNFAAQNKFLQWMPTNIYFWGKVPLFQINIGLEVSLKKSILTIFTIFTNLTIFNCDKQLKK